MKFFRKRRFQPSLAPQRIPQVKSGRSYWTLLEPILKNWLLKSNLCHRARSALPYLPFYRSASVGRSLAGRPTWLLDFLLVLLRVQLCLCFAAGCGRLQNTASSHHKFLQVKQFVFIDVFVRSPAYNKLKTPTKAGGKASHEQRFKANWQNFAPTQNFAQKKEQEIKRYQGTDFDVYYTIIPSICNMLFIISDSEIMLDICVFMVYIFIGE